MCSPSIYLQNWLFETFGACWTAWFCGFCPGGNWVRWSLPAKNAGSACWSDPGIHLVLLDSELSIQSTFAIVYIFLHLYICITYLKCIIYVYIIVFIASSFFAPSFPNYTSLLYITPQPGGTRIWGKNGKKNPTDKPGWYMTSSKGLAGYTLVSTITWRSLEWHPNFQ